MSNFNRNYCSAPCMGCENKGCGVYHDKCEKYTAWKREQAELKEKMRLENETRTTAGYCRKRRTK